MTYKPFLLLPVFIKKKLGRTILTKNKKKFSQMINCKMQMRNFPKQKKCFLAEQ